MTSNEIKKDKNNENNFLVVNGEIVIKNGIIIGNPFFKDFANIEMANYIFGGSEGSSLVRNKVEYKIRKKIREVILEKNLGISLDLESDCYEYVIDYFLSRKTLYKKNYFGKDSTYSVEKYLFSNIEYAVMQYRSSLEKSGDAIYYSRRILDNNESEMGNYGIPESLVLDSKYSIDTDFGNIDSDYEKDYSIVYKYIVDLLEENNYIMDTLDIKEIIYHFFLVYYPTDGEKVDSISKNCNVDAKFVEVFLEDVQKSLKKDNEDTKGFLKSLKNLIENNRL